MKITLDKSCITLEEAPAANELRNEYREYDKDTIETLISGAIKANRHRVSEHNAWEHKVLNIESAEVTKNRHRLTVWISCTVRYDLNTIVYIGFDAVDAMSYYDGATVDAYIEVYIRKL